MSKYLIFGATGSIGTKLAEELYKSNKEIHLIGRNKDELQILSSKLNCDYTVLDILNDNISEFVKSVCKGRMRATPSSVAFSTMKSVRAFLIGANISQTSGGFC